MEFYYQIRGRDAQGNWTWPPLYSDKIEATDSKEAREMLQEMYGLPMPGRELKAYPDYPILCTITPMDKHINSHIRGRFEERECRQCGAKYTEIEKYKLQSGGSRDFCSVQCTERYKIENTVGSVTLDFEGIHDPVIYKITNRVTQKCYIGKTTQAFTLRWYQHFFQSAPTTKFYEAIRAYPITDWTFEIVECIDMPKGVDSKEQHRIILEREQHWIRECNSIRNGYNSATSIKQKVDEKTILKLDFDNEHEEISQAGQ